MILYMGVTAASMTHYLSYSSVIPTSILSHLAPLFFSVCYRKSAQVISRYCKLEIILKLRNLNSNVWLQILQYVFFHLLTVSSLRFTVVIVVVAAAVIVHLYKFLIYKAIKTISEYVGKVEKKSSVTNI